MNGFNQTYFPLPTRSELLRQGEYVRTCRVDIVATMVDTFARQLADGSEWEYPTFGELYGDLENPMVLPHDCFKRLAEGVLNNDGQYGVWDAIHPPSNKKIPVPFSLTMNAPAFDDLKAYQIMLSGADVVEFVEGDTVPLMINGDEHSAYVVSRNSDGVILDVVKIENIGVEDENA